MFSKLSKNFEGQKMFQILEKVNLIEKSKKVIHLEIGQPSHQIPNKIIDDTILSLKKHETGYVSSKGILELRENIQKTTKISRNFVPNLDQILITPGANSIIYILMRVLCDPGDEVIIPDPGFPTYISAARSLGLKIKFLKLNEKKNFQIDEKLLRKIITRKTRLVIINSPSNPLGIIQSKETLKKIFHLIKNTKSYILSDEIYSRIVFNNNEFFSISEMDKCKNKVILLNGFSKAFSMTGYRLGVAIGPKKIVHKMNILLETVVSCVPPFIQKGGISAINLNKSFINKEINNYIYKKNLFMNFFDNSLINCVNPGGAFYLFPNVKKLGLDGVQFSKILLEKLSIAVVPGIYFGKSGKHNIRIAYTASIKDIEISIKKIKNYFKI